MPASAVQTSEQVSDITSATATKLTVAAMTNQNRRFGQMASRRMNRRDTVAHTDAAIAHVGTSG
jgi:hypothetical protein